MRRAAVQAFRTARCTPVRRILTPRTLPISAANHGIGQRLVSSTARNHGLSQILQSSMYFRGFSVGALLSLLASGAYYYIGDSKPGKAALVDSTTATSEASSPSLNQKAGAYSISGPPSTAATPLASAGGEEPVAQTPRKALVVEDDQFYTHDISDDAPLSKETDTQRQQQLEMLTPDQATERLRRNEESYFVGRGRGVVRYDVVQIPSNNPIEDDHAEKIVEVPQSVTPSEDGSSNTDWMFWGVFDGHR